MNITVLRTQDITLEYQPWVNSVFSLDSFSGTNLTARNYCGFRINDENLIMTTKKALVYITVCSPPRLYLCKINTFDKIRSS